MLILGEIEGLVMAESLQFASEQVHCRYQAAAACCDLAFCVLTLFSVFGMQVQHCMFGQ